MTSLSVYPNSINTNYLVLLFIAHCSLILAIAILVIDPNKQSLNTKPIHRHDGYERDA